MALGGAGILMNVDVVLLNRAMPVAVQGGIELASMDTAVEIARSSGAFYRAALGGDLLPWLGDVIPFALGRSAFLISPGDVVLMVAVVVALVFCMADERSEGVATISAG